MNGRSPCKLLWMATVLVTLAACTPAPPPAAREQPAPSATAAAPAVAAVAPTTAPPAAPVKVRVGLVPGTPSSGVYLALTRGYFAEEGLDVEYENFDAGERTIPSLATGQIEVSASGLSAGLYGAVARGADLKVVAGQTTNAVGSASSALVMRKDLLDTGAIRDLIDLRGRTGALIAPSTSFAVDMYRGLQAAGVNDTEIDWQILSFSDQVTALANKAIDFGTITEPFVARAVQQGIGVRWRGMDELFPNHQLTAVMYNPAFATDNPSAAERWLVAYLRGARDFVDAFQHNRDRAAVVQVLIENTPIKDPVLYDLMVPSGISPDGELNQESMDYDQDWYLTRGYIREKIELSRVVDLRYRDAALQRIGRYVPRS